jgi:hypothetical protein
MRVHIISMLIHNACSHTNTHTETSYTSHNTRHHSRHTLSLQTLYVDNLWDRAAAQVVSRWLPTAAARVRVRAACGVCGGQSGIIIITRGWHNTPTDSRSAKWTQLDSTPHYSN